MWTTLAVELTEHVKRRDQDEPEFEREKRSKHDNEHSTWVPTFGRGESR